jgi:hypothetical protein
MPDVAPATFGCVPPPAGVPHACDTCSGVQPASILHPAWPAEAGIARLLFMTASTPARVKMSANDPNARTRVRRFTGTSSLESQEASNKALSCKGRGRERHRGPCQLQRIVIPPAIHARSPSSHCKRSPDQANGARLRSPRDECEVSRRPASPSPRGKGGERST